MENKIAVVVNGYNFHSFKKKSFGLFNLQSWVGDIIRRQS